jgi:hypothetical protein
LGEKTSMELVRKKITVQGELLKVKSVAYSVVDRRTYGNRGEIKEFTSQSRKRMLEMFATLDRAKIKFGKQRVKFITLTYPDYEGDLKRAKRDMDTLFKRIVRKFPDACGVWKLEFQQRGVPHFHIMLFNVKWWNVTHMQQTWNEVTGTDANNSLDLEVIKSFNGVMYYVAKYMGKAEKIENGAMGLSVSHISPQEQKHSAPEFIGRFWGVFNRAKMPFAKKRTIEHVYSTKAWKWLMSVIDSKYASLYSGFSIFSDGVNPLFKTMNTVGDKERTNGFYGDWQVSRRIAYENWLGNVRTKLGDRYFWEMFNANRHDNAMLEIAAQEDKALIEIDIMSSNPVESYYQEYLFV